MKGEIVPLESESQTIANGITPADVAKQLILVAEHLRCNPNQTAIMPGQLATRIGPELQGLLGQITSLLITDDQILSQYALINEAARIVNVNYKSVTQALDYRRLIAKTLAGGRKVVNITDCRRLW